MVDTFNTPVLLNVFNRPEETLKVIEAISRVQPDCLYVHCDGPREGNADDVINVGLVREIIYERITWPCKLHTLFEDHNLGCGKGPATSISWFFSNVEEGIILEDDCCPCSDFFYYCQELLARYRADSRIAIISGTNFSPTKNPVYSYKFTAYAGIWGWATWRRTWQLFDYNFSCNDEDFVARVKPFVKSNASVSYWLKILHTCIADGKNKTYWDYQLHLSLLFANKIHIRPMCNLVSNIGFNANATHTTDSNSKYSNCATFSIMPLVHPTAIRINRRIDNHSYKISLCKRIKSRCKKLYQYVKR